MHTKPVHEHAVCTEAMPGSLAAYAYAICLGVVILEHYTTLTIRDPLNACDALLPPVPTCRVSEHVTKARQVVFRRQSLKPFKNGQGMMGQPNFGQVLQQCCTCSGVQAAQSLGYCRDW